jgi:hypothetical protein
MKRREAVLAFGVACVGLAWSWVGHVYDLRSAEARVAVTLTGIAASFILMWGGLAVARVPKTGRAAAAALAILPWNGVLLSQLAYVGYMFIPLEVVASMLLLRRTTPLSLFGAFALAATIRGIAFVVTISAAAAVRYWLPQ